MKKFICLFTTILITALFILTSCQTTSPEPEVCSTCKNEKSIGCESCYGRGEGVCQHCSGSGKCGRSSCEGGYEYEMEDCENCTNGVIVNPFTWATFDCPKCYYGYVEVKKECFLCDGENECFFCDGTGLAKDCDSGMYGCDCEEIAGQCKDCQGLGKIDCPDCE